MTRDGRLQETIHLVRARGGEVAGIYVFIDRSGGDATFVVPEISLLKWEPLTWGPEN